MPRRRRNSDARGRRREREVTTQEELDGLVAHKLRTGGVGDLTLRELQQASPELIPREAVQQAFQDAFNRLDAESAGTARLVWKGADLTLFTGDDGRLVAMFETGDIDQEFAMGIHEIPALRVWVNEDWVETNADGGWTESQ